MAVHQLIATLPLSDPRLAEIRTKTATDQNLQVLKHFILTGWPNQRKDYPTTIMEHWNHRDELVYQDDMIFKGDRIVIPKEMRPEMLMRVHEGHLGIEKCRARARMALFWPDMNADIEQTVANCGTCQMHRTANTKETLVNHPIPNLPREMVASDLFTLDGRDYVLVVDYYSNYPEVEHLPDTRSETVINKLKAILARHGKCLKFVSDNGPQYASSEFAKFASEWGFEHVTSSPTYPQSNSLAERTVQTIKQLMKKAKEEKKDVYLSLLELCNTPVHGTMSPAQLLMSRRLRSSIPCTNKQLRPSITAPSAYIVHGGVYRRNRRHLLKTQENHTFRPQEPEDDQLDSGQLNGSTLQPEPQGAPTLPGPEPPAPNAATPKATAPAVVYKTRAGRVPKPRKILDL